MAIRFIQKLSFLYSLLISSFPGVASFNRCCHCHTSDEFKVSLIAAIVAISSKISDISCIPLQLISLDYLRKREFSGRHVHILVLIDHFSRLMVATANVSPTIAGATDVLRHHWISYFKAPAGILCDHRGAFVAASLVQYVCTRQG